MNRLLTILVASSALGAAQASIVFQAEPPSAPDKLPLAQLAPVPMSTQSLMIRGRQFGITDARAAKSPRGLVLQQGTLVLAQDPMGAELFADTNRFMSEAPGEADPPADADVLKLANDAIRKRPGRVKYTDLVFEAFHHLKNQGQDLRANKLTSITQDETIVVYHRLLNGVPVVPTNGDGEHVRLHFDNKGALTGQQMVWRNVRGLTDSVPMLPYAQVRDAFLRQLTQEMGDTPNEAIVTRIDFGYFGRPEGQPQGWFQPAYLFTVSFYDADEKQVTAARIIPVLAIDPKFQREPLQLPSPPSEQGTPSQVHLKIDPPQPLGSMPVIAIVPNTVNVDTIQQRAKALGMTGTTKPTPRGLAVSDGHFLLAQDPAGSEFYADLDYMMNEVPGKNPPMSDAVAQRLAYDWLSKQGVPTAELGTPVVHRLMHQAADTKGGDPLPPTSDEAIVDYPRVLHSASGAPVPTVGQGAFASVHIDNLGNVTGEHRLWRQAGQILKTTELRPYSAIFDEFQRHLLSELGRSQANVVGAKYGVYFRPEGVQQGFAQPVVLFDVDILDPDTGNVTAHKQIPVPAGSDLMEPLDDPDSSLVPNNPADEGFRDADNVPPAFGDVDLNGVVDAQDVALVLQNAGGLAGPLSPQAIAAGDVSPAGGNGQLQTDDALRILRSIFHLDDISNGP